MKKTQNRKQWMVRTLLALALVPACGRSLAQKTVYIERGQTVTFVMNRNESTTVQAAAWMLKDDFARALASDVTFVSDKAQPTDDGSPRIHFVTRPESFRAGAHQAYRLSVERDGELLVEGSEPLGTAYGLMELSRRLGVTPWKWWSNAEVKPLDSFNFTLVHPQEDAPVVEHRGIFINDEDWSIAPWATAQQREIGDVEGPWRFRIGPGVTERVCQLLLRLKADTYWPAMHQNTRPFFFTEGDRQMLATYGLYIGTSHCEPLASNAFGEWETRGKGDYNFATNRDEVIRFWQQRLDEVKSQPVIYTMGMRGADDVPMEGAATEAERRALLEDILGVQEQMLDSTLGTRRDSVLRIFIPYKEVMEDVEAGLRVPDDVAVIQCDDNYGYIIWPSDSLLSRPAGTGLYYHVSYRGRPQDNLWLSTTHPRIMQEELVRYSKQTARQRLWVVNVGDIKPAEYQIQLFMDIAWCPTAFNYTDAWYTHLKGFLSSNLALSLDASQTDRLAETLREYYDLMEQCRPEFLAGTRVEEQDPRWTHPVDLPWGQQTMLDYRDRLLRLSREVDRVNPSVAWMHLVQYPVQGAAQMAQKHVAATLARHGLGTWEESDRAHDSIQALTARYNVGTWDGFMCDAPRGLPVFQKVERTTVSTPLPEEPATLLTTRLDATLAPLTADTQPLQFETKSKKKGQALTVEVSILPTHPRHSQELSLEVTLDGVDTQTLDFTTQGRSEEWKQGVLHNSATRTLTLHTAKGKAHTLSLRPLSGGEIYPLEVRTQPAQ